jgi:hypothetical protein
MMMMIVSQNKEMKLLYYSKIDKFGVKVANKVDLIGNVVISVVSCFELNTPNLAMFHLGNIIDLGRD